MLRLDIYTIAVQMSFTESCKISSQTVKYYWSYSHSCRKWSWQCLEIKFTIIILYVVTKWSISYLESATYSKIYSGSHMTTDLTPVCDISISKQYFSLEIWSMAFLKNFKCNQSEICKMLWCEYDWSASKISFKNMHYFASCAWIRTYQAVLSQSYNRWTLALPLL